MKKQNSKCEKSPTGEHDFVYPRMEDSIDRDRGENLPEPYCKYCLNTQIFIPVIKGTIEEFNISLSFSNPCIVKINYSETIHNILENLKKVNGLSNEQYRFLFKNFDESVIPQCELGYDMNIVKKFFLVKIIRESEICVKDIKPTDIELIFNTLGFRNISCYEMISACIDMNENTFFNKIKDKVNPVYAYGNHKEKIELKYTSLGFSTNKMNDEAMGVFGRKLFIVTPSL